MSHQNTDSEKATAQNAVTDPQAPGDQPRSTRPEPKSYAAADSRDSTLAPPAAGEIGDYADEGDELGGGLGSGSLGEVQEGGDRRNRDLHAHDDQQGPKTRAANRAMSRLGSPDQGTQ